jgi:hypothetical protein
MMENKKPSFKNTFITLVLIIIFMILQEAYTQSFLNYVKNKSEEIELKNISRARRNDSYVRRLEIDKLEEEEKQKKINYEEITKPEKVLFRREIIISNIGNEETLKDYQICLTINTQKLIREEKLSFDCRDIYFTDSDGTTLIPFWIKRDCGYENSEIWLKLPQISPNENKKIYFYYGNRDVESKSSFEDVFTPREPLECWYYFDEPESTEILDLSGNKKNGYLSKISYGGWAGTFYEENGRHYIFFNDWKARYAKNEEEIKKGCVYFTIPSQNLAFDKSEGSIEMWIRPYMFNPSEGDIKRFHKILTDTNKEIELGIFPGGNLYFSPSNSGYFYYSEKKETDNFDVADLKVIPEKWSHILITWKLSNKEVNFYLNGEKKTKLIENIKNYWYGGAEMGDWLIGGSYLNVGTNYVGYIDGLQIYSKALDEKSVKEAYKFNSRNTRFPNFSFGKEELVLKEDLFKEFDFSKVIRLKPDYNISINLHYATPLDESEEWYGWSLYTKSEKNAFLINKNKKDYIPIFGVPSHFFSYEGTETSFQDTYLLYYVGLKINNPDLIKDLKIEFKEIETYSDLYLNLKEIILPSAYACGPYYSYKIVGESELELVEKNDDIYWYKLKKPILINNKTKMMQLYIKTTNKEGFFSLKIEDMIFINKNKKFTKPTYWQHSEDEKFYYGTYHPVPEYRAWFAREEKGLITFKQSKINKAMVISFENRGDDEIFIDGKSIDYIETQLIDRRILNFQIVSPRGDVLLDIPMSHIKEKINGKKIKPGESLDIPLFYPSPKLKSGDYFITAKTGEKTDVRMLDSSIKIINWSLGEDSYHYYNTFFKGTLDISICEFRIRDDLSIEILRYP